MLVLPTLHSYLSQLLSPPSIHTALLLTPEGALVSYASRMTTESSPVLGTFTQRSHSSSSGSLVSVAGAALHSPGANATPSSGSSDVNTPQGSKPGSIVASIETRSGSASPHQQRSKDEIRMAAGLGAEVWAETREEGSEGMVESELGRILVLAVDNGETSEEGAEPLLLLAVNGTLEADWETMRIKARKLASYLAPSVNKHRRTMGAGVVNGALGNGKSRTPSTATSPGRGANR